MPRKVVTCLYCDKPIRSGRADKKFCDSGCKDSYNNERKENERSEISAIELVLKKNRRVLKKLYNPQKQDKLFSREVMIREGFEFGFLTHIAVTKVRSNEIVFCYDYGYREIEENNFQLYPSFSKVQVKGGYQINVN